MIAQCQYQSSEHATAIIHLLHDDEKVWDDKKIRQKLSSHEMMSLMISGPKGEKVKVGKGT